MDYKNCELYKIKRKRDLYSLLCTDENKVNDALYKYKVCIKDEKRLLEKPCEELKKGLKANQLLIMQYIILIVNIC